MSSRSSSECDLSLDRLPIQMTPDISRPVISIETAWRAAAPNEIESEIIEPQEDVLRSIPGLVRMQSSANYGLSFVNLQFSIGTDMNRALIEVMNRLNQVLFPGRTIRAEWNRYFGKMRLSSASCRPRASRCRSSPTVAPRWW